MHAWVITIMATGGFNPEICIPGKGDCTNKEGTVFMVYMSGVCSLCANLKFSWLELVKNKDCFISNGLFIWKKIEHLALSGFVVADVEYQKLIAEKHRSNHFNNQTTNLLSKSRMIKLAGGGWTGFLCIYKQLTLFKRKNKQTFFILAYTKLKEHSSGQGNRGQHFQHQLFSVHGFWELRREIESNHAKQHFLISRKNSLILS